MAQRAVNAIIRPPRSEYDYKTLPLLLEVEHGRTFLRHPVTFVNKRGQQIVGSIYHAANFSPLNGGPCVMYLHGNASSQLEGQFLVPNFCPYGVFVFCFDFIGCGCSDGEYVSLGYFEQTDVEYLINVLRLTFNLGPFVLWGRSMGASTTLLVRSPHVVGKVSDSAFTSIADMCSAIALSMKLPNAFVPMVIWFLRKKVMGAANFNFDDVSPLNAVMGENQVPVVFGHAEKDQFIPFEQCLTLYKNYNSKMKYMLNLPGGHNSKRNKDWITLGVMFAMDQFGIPTDNVQISECRKLQKSDFHFSSFSNMVDKAPALNNNDMMEEFQMDGGNVEMKPRRHRSKTSVDGSGKRRRRRHHTTAPGAEGHHRHSRTKAPKENNELQDNVPDEEAQSENNESQDNVSNEEAQNENNNQNESDAYNN